jgi:hypothetical protein
MHTRKDFAIGFHKTGTKSLGAALAQLRYRVAGPFGAVDPDIARTALPRALRICEEFDAFQDNPWPILFRELDQRFAGSRFILTLRSADDWIASATRHFGRHSTPMRQWIYGAGCPAGNETTYTERFMRHNDDVRAHFAARPEDLLVMDLFAGDGWSKLCGFLGVEAPHRPFPHVNAGATTERPMPISSVPREI